MDTARKAKAPSEIHIKRAVNGGYIVRHSFDNMGAGESYQPPKEHAFTGHKEMMAHIHAATGAGKVAPETQATSENVDDRTTGQPAAPSKSAGKKAAATRGGGID